MKKLFTFILILSTIIINAQNALDKRFIMVAEWDDNILLNDSMWRVNALFSEDQLNGGYLPTQIQVGYLALDATGRRYRVKNIVDATFSTATLDLVEEADLNMPPIGVGIVYVKNLTDIIHSVVHSNTQISPSLMSKIFIHNMVKIDEVALVSSDYTRLLQDSIVVYYANNAEIGRDTVRLNIVSDLENLADVDITGVADKSILYYDLASQKWRDTTSNVYISGSGSANRIPIYNGNTSITSNSNLTFDGTTFNANSAAVFNDAGAAVDFRVESDNDANKLFVSGSTDRVGIGINSPTNTLDIDGTLRIRNLNSVTSTGLLGVDANGVAERITIGTGLNLTNDVLTATGTLSGSGTSNRVAFWSGTTLLSGNDSLFYDSANGRLGIGGITNPRVGLEVNADQIVVASNVWTSVNVLSKLWLGITYGNGLFVAVSAVSGTSDVMYSQDGKNWKYTNSTNGARDWTDITYGSGKFVAIADFSSTDGVMTSSDGQNWVSSAVISSRFRSITYGNGLFVIVGVNVIATSPDGLTWTYRTVPESNSWEDVTYGNGLFVAVSRDGTNRIMTSSDGITWNLVTTPQNNDLRSVTYGDGKFVIVSSTGTNRVFTSTDGINWDLRNASEQVSWRCVTYGEKLFVALSVEGDIMTSLDGITWIKKIEPEIVRRNSIVYGNGLFVSVGDTGTDRVTISGKQNININREPPSYVIEDIVNRYVGIDISPRVPLEVNGKIVNKGNLWTSRTSPENNPWRAVAYGNGRYVAISQTGTSRIMVSEDAINWRILNLSGNYYDITYGNGLFVIVNATTGSQKFLISPDGINWTTSSVTSSTEILSVTYGNGLFVAVGYTSTGRVMTSPDGINWTIRSYPLEQSWWDVTYGNGLFVAVARGGTTVGQRVMTSPDGINWTAQVTPADLLWSSINYGNGLFVATAETNGTQSIMTSLDGVNWTQRSYTGSLTLRNIVYGEGVYVIPATDNVGAYFLSSIDGISWVRRNAPTFVAYTGVTYGNGLFVAVGQNAIATSGDILYKDVPHNNQYNGNHRFTQNVSIGTSNQPAYSLDIPTTNAIRIPSGTTAQRPTAVQGILRYNSSNNNTEFHTGTAWEYPLKSATENGLGTANQVFFADANGRASGSSAFTFSNNQVNSLYFNGSIGYNISNTSERQSTCSSVRVNNGTLASIGAGAIDITVPAKLFRVSSFSSKVTFDVTVNPSTTSTYRTFTVSVNYIQGSTPVGIVYSNDNNNNSSINYRFGRDSLNNLKVYIGELNSNIGGAVYITNVFHTSLALPSDVPANFLCSDWTVTANTTGFLNATSPVPVQQAFNSLYKNHSTTFHSLGETFGVFIGGTTGSTTGAFELTLNKTQNMTQPVRLFLELVYVDLLSNNHNTILLSGDVSLSTMSWSNVNFEFIGGLPNSSRYNIRVGNDGTNLKIWIGELTQSNGAYSNITVKNVIIQQRFSVSQLNVRQFLDITDPVNWSFTIQSTAFGTVNQTLLVNSANSIPFSSTARHAYSSNFVYDNTNTRLGIGTSTPAYSLDITSTNAIKLPTGTTAQRPTVAQGLLRYNTNTMELDVHDGTNWRRVIDIADTNASTGDVVSFTGTAYAAVSQRRGVTTLSTDASGDITLSITMPDATYSAVAIPDGQTFYVITAHTKTTSSVKFRIYDSTGNIVPSGTSVSINYNITDY